MNRKNDHLKLVENETRAPVWKRCLRFLAKVVVLAAIVFLLWQGEAYFRIAVIIVEVEGAGDLQKEEVLRAGGVGEGMSIFLLREKEISDRIKAGLSRVEEVEVVRLLPDKVMITVIEREPAGYVMTADGFWLIDKRGVVMTYIDEPQEDHPLISGIDGRKVIPGAPIDCPARLEALQNFFAAWSGEGGMELEKLDLQESYNLIARTKDGLEIWFGEGEGMVKKLRLIEESLPYIDPATGARLDVRCGRRLVVSGSAVIQEEEMEVEP